MIGNQNRVRKRTKKIRELFFAWEVFYSRSLPERLTASSKRERGRDPSPASFFMALGLP